MSVNLAVEPVAQHGGAESRHTNDEVWLLGQPPLHEYLDFISETAIGGEDESPAALTQEWCRANDYYQRLEELEAGIADRAERRDPDPCLATLVAGVMADPYFRNAFDTLPTTIGMVELEKLIAYQKSVTWSFVEQAKARLGPSPGAEAVFHFCLPVGERDTRIEIRRGGARRFLFHSESMDLRFHATKLFGPEQVLDHDPVGPVAGVVGMVVGFGSNFLNVIRADNRLLLHNGYHRACALLDLGIRHAPAIIQTVTRFDELGLTARRVVTEDPDFYFKSARPPLIKDFFDPSIRRVIRTPKLRKVIELTYEVRDYTIPE